MPTNEIRRELLNRSKASGYPGSITEVFQAADQGIDLIEQYTLQQQQEQQMQVAETPQQQEVGLREQHAMGNTQASMAFPDVQPNQSFNTVGMEAPIDIQKIDDQGHLVESYKNVPPGIQDLPTGPSRGTVIESPAAYQKGGFSREDSLDIYNKQTHLNKLADELNSHISKNTYVTDDKGRGNQRTYAKQGVDHTAANRKGQRLKGEYLDQQFKYYKEYYQKGMLGKDNPFTLSRGNPDFYDSDVDIAKGNQTWGLNKYKTVKPSESKQEELNKVKNKNLEKTHIQISPGDSRFEELWESGGSIYRGDGTYWIKKKKKEKLLKISPKVLQTQLLPTTEVQPTKAIPFELVKNKTPHYTIERAGIGTHTFPKGDDNKSLIILKDQAGRRIFKGSQTEYNKKYGEFLEKGTTEYGKRRKNRLYLKKQKGGLRNGPDIVPRETEGGLYFPAGHPDRRYINPTIELGPAPKGMTEEELLKHEMEHYKQDIEGRLTTGPSKFLKRRPHFISSSQQYNKYYNRKAAERELASQMYFENVPHRVNPIAVNNPAFTDLLDKKALKEWPEAQYYTPGTVEYEAVQAEKKSKGGVRSISPRLTKLLRSAKQNGGLKSDTQGVVKEGDIIDFTRKKTTGEIKRLKPYVYDWENPKFENWQFAGSGPWSEEGSKDIVAGSYPQPVLEPDIDNFKGTVDWMKDYTQSGYYKTLLNKMKSRAADPSLIDQGDKSTQEFMQNPYIITDDAGYGTQGNYGHHKGSRFFPNYRGLGSTIVMGDDDYSMYYSGHNPTRRGILAHELGHTDKRFLTKDANITNEIISRNKLLQDGTIDEYHHDAKAHETRADLVQFRHDLQDQGILDSTGDFKEFTKEDILKAKNKEGIGQRLFEHFSDEDIIWFMNNVAQGTPTGTGNPFEVADDFGGSNFISRKGGVRKYSKGGLSTAMSFLNLDPTLVGTIESIKSRYKSLTNPSYTRGKLHLKGKIDPRANIGWNPRGSVTPWGEPTLRFGLGAGIRGSYKANKNLTFTGGVGWDTHRRPTYSGGLSFRLQEGGFNPDDINPTPYNPLDKEFPLRNTPFPQGRRTKGAPWEVKKGVRAVESSNGVLMKNPDSSATGFYGQLYNEIKDLSFMEDINRDAFAADTMLQNKVFDMRWKGEIPGVPGLKGNIKRLRSEYKDLTSDFTDNELAVLSNYIGRQGAREYFAARKIGEVYVPPGKNKSVKQYMHEYRNAIKKKKSGGYRIRKKGGYKSKYCW